ncbi:hypothetical protein M427DRAFT_132065 [Gonapodya prolifera JEL478]|uniref:Uncharacterized protein n=1 Tax=Gonapodya prolifera (strain JEL478) TaxID=1344416 RepID=A0A139AS45_GONPJ|nr:hypothetical protein M427DRAFT_132065 [Gonapodya prolifera JEL478]|eukprot:KXS19576.1 hypothetical protein M427DRAFT_132065 [Gonapodya prolifera JEL478]
MAVAYAKLWRKGTAVAQVFDAYIEAAREAEETRDREYMAAFKIGRAWRAFRNSRREKMLSLNATVVQRIYRGYVGRKTYLKLLQDREDSMTMTFRNKMATRIQRVWRGYSSRKNVFSYYARKAYILQVQRKTEEVRKMLAEEEQRKREEKQVLRKQRLEARIDKLAGKLHHLVGTKAVKGVWADVVDPVDAVMLVGSTPSPLNALPIPNPSKGHLKHPRHHLHDHNHHNPHVDEEYRRSISHPPHKAELRVCTHSVLKMSEGATAAYDPQHRMAPITSARARPQASRAQAFSPQQTLPLVRIPESRIRSSNEVKTFVQNTVGTNWKGIRVKPQPELENTRLSTNEGPDDDGQTCAEGPQVEVKGPFMAPSKLKRRLGRIARPSLRVETSYYSNYHWQKENDLNDKLARVSTLPFKRFVHPTPAEHTYFLKTDPYWEQPQPKSDNTEILRDLDGPSTVNCDRSKSPSDKEQRSKSPFRNVLYPYRTFDDAAALLST